MSTIKFRPPPELASQGSLKNREHRRRSKMTTLQMWNAFEKETKTNPAIECVYRTSGLREVCDECGSILALSEEGYPTCTNPSCSIIYTDIVDQSPEWRYYGNDDSSTVDPTRCGMPINPLLPESSFGCKVSCPYGNRMPYHMHRMRKYTEYQSVPHHEKTMFNEFQTITMMAQNAGIPKIIIDDAHWFHKQMSDTDHSLRGSHKHGIIAASIYLACRKHNCPRTAKEIATIFHLEHGSATYGCKKAQFIWRSIERDVLDSDKLTFCVPKSSDFIERFCTHLNMSEELTKLCLFISMKLCKMNIMTDTTPNSVASGIIYFVSHLCSANISKKDIRNMNGISEVTINKCYKRIAPITAQIVPKSILDKYTAINTPSDTSTIDAPCT